jgi:hypothetical protein
MIEQDLTQELWEPLTPQQIAARLGLTQREVDVLRKRLNIGEKPKKNSAVPPEGSEGNGSGGVPAPAKPPN